MNKGFQKRRISANCYKFPHSVHRYRLSSYKQLKAVTEIAMKQMRSEVLSTLQGGDLDPLKETLAKYLDCEESFKAIVGKRQRKEIGRPKQRPILISAIEEGNLEKVKDLLSEGVDCNVVQVSLCHVGRKERLHALHRATQLGLTDIVEVLLDAGADCNVSDENSNTPLHIAVNKRNTSIVRLLLSSGADPKLTDHDGNAAIHVATSQGHLNLVRTLIEFNADIHQMNSFGQQPVHLAAAAGHFHIIHLLCSADPRNVMARDSAGHCPLHLATENGHVETVTALLDLFGADPNEKNLEEEVALVRLLHQPYRKNIMRDMVYYYATFMALVQYGASLDVENHRGLTLLEIAETNQYKKIAEYLKTVKCAANAGEQKSLNRDTVNARVAPSARETCFGNTDSTETLRTDLCEVQSASVKQMNEKHVSFMSAGNEVNHIQHETLSHSSHLLHASKVSASVGKTCEQDEVAESIENVIPTVTNQVTVSQYLARNELLNSAASPAVNHKPVQPSAIQPQHASKVSLANECHDVTSSSQEEPIAALEDETMSTVVSVVNDDGKESERKTGMVCLVKLEPVRPDHYVIQTLSTSNSNSNSSRRRLPDRMEADSDMKLCAELTAFDEDFGVSDEDFSEDFLSDTDSSTDSECVSGEEITVSKNQDGALEKQIRFNGNCNLKDDFSVKELVSYFKDEVMRKSFDHGENHEALSSVTESKNETVSEEQKTIPTIFPPSDNSYRPGQNEDKEICTDQSLIGVDFSADGPQTSDQKQVVKVNASHESKTVSELSQSEDEVQVTDVTCSAGSHLFPLEMMDLINYSRSFEEPEESAMKPSEADDVHSKTQPESNVQVNGGTVNGSGISRDNELPSEDGRLLSSADSPALHSNENQAEADVRSWENIDDSIQQIQSETYREVVSDDDVPCNVKPKDVKQKLKKKKKVNKTPQKNEDFERTDCTKGLAVHPLESPVDVGSNEQLTETVRQNNNESELAASEIEVVDCYSAQSLNRSTAREEQLNDDISVHSFLSTSDLGLKVAKVKRKKKKTKEGESVQTESMESTFDDDPAFTFIQQSAEQTVSNTQQEFAVEADPPSFKASKHVVKKKKKKNIKIAEAIELPIMSDEGTQRNWRTNLDEALVVMQLQEEPGHRQIDQFHRYNSSSNNDDLPKIEETVTTSKASAIRSELRSAFGISEDTNVDSIDLMKDDLYNREEKRASTENALDWTGGSHEDEDDDRHLILPKGTSVHRGKQKALGKNTETNLPLMETAIETDNPLVVPIITEERYKPADGKMSSPRVFRMSVKSRSSSFGCLGTDGKLVSSESRTRDTRQNAPEFNQMKSIHVNASKETCVDDDFDEGDAVERVTDMSTENPIANDCSHKETDVDEIFNYNDQQFRPEEETDPHVSEQIHAGYVDSNTRGTATESTNDVELSLHDSSSVGIRSNLVKKGSKKKKSQKRLETNENSKLESAETPSDEFAAHDLPESETIPNNPVGCNESPEPHFNGSFHEKEMILAETISNDSLDAAAEYHGDTEQEKLEAVFKDAADDDSDKGQRVPALHSPVVSEESRTETEDESDSSDNSSGEFLFGQSRTLFTIKELNAEAESEVEDEQPIEVVEDKGTYRDPMGYPLGDDWDDFDLSELHTRPLEKIRLTTQTVEIGRRFYEDETDDEDQMEQGQMGEDQVGRDQMGEDQTEQDQVEHDQVGQDLMGQDQMGEDQTEQDQIATATTSECLNELPTLSIESPTMQPFSASPPIQPRTVTPPIQPCTTSTSIEPSSVASDMVSSILGQDDEKPVQVMAQELIVRDVAKVVKMRPSKKKKSSSRSFQETSFDDMEPVSFQVGISSENSTDSVCHNSFDRTAISTNSTDIPAVDYEPSNKSTISKNKKPCFQGSSVSSESLEQKQEPVKKRRHRQKGSAEVELSELPSLLQDRLNDREDLHQTMAKSKQGSEVEEEVEEEGLRHETQDLGDVDVAVSQPSPHRLMKNVHFSEEKAAKPESQTKEHVEDDLVSDNVERGENEKLITDGTNDEADCSKCFCRTQTGRVSKGRQKRGSKRPTKVTTDKSAELVFASPNTNDALSDLVFEETSKDAENTEFFEKKSVSKRMPNRLSSSFEIVESSSKESDQNSRKLASNVASEVTVLRRRDVSGKPPLPRAVERKASADGSNQSSPDPIQGNTFRAVHSADAVHRISHPLQGIRDDKMLSSEPEAAHAGAVVQQWKRDKTFPLSVCGLSSSFEEKMSDQRRPSLKSADRSPFERPRSADGITNAHLIPQHPVVSHPSHRQMRRRPGSQKVLTPDEIRRRQLTTSEPRPEPIAVQAPQKTLQEAAFESITASILNQSKFQPGRKAKSEGGPVTYSRGVYRPQQVVFRGSLSAGSGFDDSRTSADMGYHPSSGSGNESWNGNE